MVRGENAKFLAETETIYVCPVVIFARVYVPSAAVVVEPTTAPDEPEMITFDRASALPL